MSELIALLKSDANAANAFGALASTVAAVLALLVSVISVFISIWAMRAQRKHNELSVRPLAEVTVADYENSLRVKLRNNGTGPMIVTDVVVADGTSNKACLVDWIPPLPMGRLWTNFSHELRDRTLQPGSEVVLLELTENQGEEEFSLCREMVRVALAPLNAPYTQQMYLSKESQMNYLALCLFTLAVTTITNAQVHSKIYAGFGYSTVLQTDYNEKYLNPIASVLKSGGIGPKVENMSGGYPVLIGSEINVSGNIALSLQGMYLSASGIVSYADRTASIREEGTFNHFEGIFGVSYYFLIHESQFSLFMNVSGGAAYQTLDRVAEYNDFNDPSAYVWYSEKAHAIVPVVKGGLGVALNASDLCIMAKVCYRYAFPKSINDFTADESRSIRQTPSTTPPSTVENDYDMTGIEFLIGVGVNL
jgi:hypothetical protein